MIPILALSGETLVQLANAGTSGLLVLIVFWTGWMIHQLPIDAPRLKYDALKTYMGMCMIVAGISGVLSWHVARNGAAKITAANQSADEAKTAAKTLLATLEEGKTGLQDIQVKMQEVEQKVATSTAAPDTKTAVSKTVDEVQRVAVQRAATIEKVGSAAKGRF